MKEIRIGVIGMGVQGKLYAGILSGNVNGAAVKKPEGLRLSAVCSRSPEAADGVPEGVHRFTDWHDLIASGCCDAVVLTVPHFQHPEIAVRAMEAGLHVLCEKPAGICADEVRGMREAEEKTGRTLALMFNNRTNPVFRRCRELAASEEMGQLRHIGWTVNSFWRPDSYYKSSGWRATWRGEGGGMVVNQLAHYLDLLLWLAGEPKTVRSVLRSGRYRDIGTENEVLVSLSYPGGATGTFEAMGYDPFGQERMEMSFSRGKLILEGRTVLKILRYRADESEWNASYPFKEFEALRRTEPEALYTEETFSEALPPLMPYVLMFENFAAHILCGEALIAGSAAGLAQVRLADCIYLSDWEEEEIPYPGDEKAFRALLEKKQKAEM